MEKEILNALKIAIKEASGKAFLVGGCVRDELLNRSFNDLDIEVFNIEEKYLSSLLEKIGPVDKVGKSFGIYTFKHTNIDIALPRKEIKKGHRHQDFKIISDPYLDYKEAASRRDITINAFMKDLETGEILDFFGGLDDLKNHKIRHINERFIEDPLRIFRACRFAAQLNFDIVQETIEISRSIDVSTLSKERINSETDKALLAVKPALYFINLAKMNKVNTFFSSLIVDDVLLNNLTLASALKNELINPLKIMYLVLILNVEDGYKFLSQFSNKNCFNHDIVTMKLLYLQLDTCFDKIGIFDSFKRIGNYQDVVKLYQLLNKERAEIVDDILFEYQKYDAKEKIKAQDLLAIGFGAGKELGTLLKQANKLLIDLEKSEVLKLMEDLWRKQKTAS